MALLTFLVLNLNGTKTLMGFIRQHAGFCRTQKLKLPSLVISRPVRFVCVKNTWSSDILGRPTWEAWAPELECLGALRAPRKFYSGDQLWGLGALTKMIGSPKGSLKFSLEHSLVYVYCSVKTVQEQAQSTRSVKLTCHRHFNFLNFEQLAVSTGWNCVIPENIHYPPPLPHGWPMEIPRGWEG